MRIFQFDVILCKTASNAALYRVQYPTRKVDPYESKHLSARFKRSVKLVSLNFKKKIFFAIVFFNLLLEGIIKKNISMNCESFNIQNLFSHKPQIAIVQLAVLVEQHI